MSIKLDNLNSFLSTKHIPDPDLIIRTGGFQRVSDFMLFQIAFSELIFLKKLWPDINRTDLKKILINLKILKENLEFNFNRFLIGFFVLLSVLFFYLFEYDYFFLIIINL